MFKFLYGNDYPRKKQRVKRDKWTSVPTEFHRDLMMGRMHYGKNVSLDEYYWQAFKEIAWMTKSAGDSISDFGKATRKLFRHFF